jgi:hypothetical protein
MEPWMSAGVGSALLSLVAVIGCSVPGMPEEKRYPLSVLERKMAACPEGMSEEAADGACLVGTYEGKTPSKEACSLTLGENGGYQFSSPAFQVAHPASLNARVSLHHTALDGYNLIIWSVSDRVDINVAFYSLRFKADFGTLMDDTESLIEIEVSETDVNDAADDRSATCRLTP